MPNLLAGRLNAVIAKENIPIVSSGLNSSNSVIAFLAEGNPYPSHRFGSTLNPLTDFINGKLYLIRTLEDMTNSNFYETLLQNGNAILWEDGNAITPE